MLRVWWVFSSLLSLGGFGEGASKRASAGKRRSPKGLAESDFGGSGDLKPARMGFEGASGGRRRIGAARGGQGGAEEPEEAVAGVSNGTSEMSFGGNLKAAAKCPASGDAHIARRALLHGGACAGGGGCPRLAEASRGRLGVRQR